MISDNQFFSPGSQDYLGTNDTVGAQEGKHQKKLQCFLSWVKIITSIKEMGCHLWPSTYKQTFYFISNYVFFFFLFQVTSIFSRGEKKATLPFRNYELSWLHLVNFQYLLGS